MVKDEDGQVRYLFGIKIVLGISVGSSQRPGSGYAVIVLYCNDPPPVATFSIRFASFEAIYLKVALFRITVFSRNLQYIGQGRWTFKRHALHLYHER